MKKLILATAIGLMCTVQMASAATELRFSWWGGNARHAATLEAIKAFEAMHPEITVKAEYSGFSGYKTQKITQFAGGTEPDLMQINWNWLPDFTPTGVGFYDLNQLKEVIDFSQFDKGSLDTLTINNKLNGITIAANGRIMVYNKTKWDEMGIKSFPKTWEELKQDGLIFKEKGGDNAYPLFVGGEGQSTASLLSSYIIQKYGINMVNEQKKSWNVSEAQMQEMFQFYQDLIDHHVMPTTKTYISEGVTDEFESRRWISGDYAGVYIWPTAIGKYADVLATGAKSAVLGEQPMLPNAKSSGIFVKPSMLYAIAKNTKHPKEAGLLLNFMLNDPKAIDILGLTRGVPLSQVAVKQLQAENKLVGIPAEGIDYVLKQNNLIRPSIYVDNQQLFSLLQEVLSGIDYGQLTIADAAKKYYTKGNIILKRSIK